jgi:hypothetical protein
VLLTIIWASDEQNRREMRNETDSIRELANHNRSSSKEDMKEMRSLINEMAARFTARDLELDKRMSGTEARFTGLDERMNAAVRRHDALTALVREAITRPPFNSELPGPPR